MRLSVRLSVYVGLTIFKVNKLLTLIAGFAPSMFYILLVIIIIIIRLYSTENRVKTVMRGSQ